MSFWTLLSHSNNTPFFSDDGHLCQSFFNGFEFWLDGVFLLRPLQQSQCRIGQEHFFAFAAGAGILGVDDLDVLSKVDIVVSDNQIQLYGLPESSNYTLFSITGQQVLKGTALNSRYDIETNGLTNGIYILEIEDADTKATNRKKIVLR